MTSPHDTPQRRASDATEDPTLKDIVKKLDAIHSNQQGYMSAFPLDDLGNPDYAGHRQAHKASIARAAAHSTYTTGLTKTILEWGLKLLLGAIGLGFFNLLATKIMEHVK